MKLLVVSAAYPAPSDPVRAVYIENLTRALRDLPPGAGPTFDPVVVAPRVQRCDPRRETRAGIPVFRFPYPSRGRRLKEMGNPSAWTLGMYFLRGLGAVLRQARRQGSDVILCHWVVPTGPIAAIACRLLRRPLVLVAHGSDVNRYAVSSWPVARLSRLALRTARRVLAVSRELAGKLSGELAVPAEKVEVLPMGVDGGIFFRREVAGSGAPEAARATARTGLGLDPSRPLLLFVGDLVASKGVPELVEAHARILAAGRDVELCLVGEGPLKAGLERRAAAPQSRLRLAGLQPQDDLLQWYRAADLLVLPSQSEGAPVVIMEALSCGLPVVATRVGGVGELITDGESGRLLEPSSGKRLEDALAAELAELLSGGGVDALRRRLDGVPCNHTAAARAAALRDILSAATCAGVPGPGGKEGSHA